MALPAPTLLESRDRLLTHLASQPKAPHRASGAGGGVLAGGGEEGVPSVYREVQGLAGDEAGVEQKRDLLTAIFDANLRMQRMTDDEGDAATQDQT